MPHHDAAVWGRGFFHGFRELPPYSLLFHPTTSNKLYEAGKQSFRELLHYFRIGSRRTLYKILRFAGGPIIAPSTGEVEIRGQNLVVIRG